MQSGEQAHLVEPLLDRLQGGIAFEVSQPGQNAGRREMEEQTHVSILLDQRTPSTRVVVLHKGRACVSRSGTRSSRLGMAVSQSDPAAAKAIVQRTFSKIWTSNPA